MANAIRCIAENDFSNARYLLIKRLKELQREDPEGLAWTMEPDALRTVPYGRNQWPVGVAATSRLSYPLGAVITLILTAVHRPGSADQTICILETAAKWLEDFDDWEAHEPETENQLGTLLKILSDRSVRKQDWAMCALMSLFVQAYDMAYDAIMAEIFRLK